MDVIGLLLLFVVVLIAMGSRVVLEVRQSILRRRWKHRCADCGYDLRGLSQGTVCPECASVKGPPKTLDEIDGYKLRVLGRVVLDVLPLGLLAVALPGVWYIVARVAGYAHPVAWRISFEKSGRPREINDELDPLFIAILLTIVLAFISGWIRGCRGFPFVRRYLWSLFVVSVIVLWTNWCQDRVTWWEGLLPFSAFLAIPIAFAWEGIDAAGKRRRGQATRSSVFGMRGPGETSARAGMHSATDLTGK